MIIVAVVVLREVIVVGATTSTNTLVDSCRCKSIVGGGDGPMRAMQLAVK